MKQYCLLLQKSGFGFFLPIGSVCSLHISNVRVGGFLNNVKHGDGMKDYRVRIIQLKRA